MCRASSLATASEYTANTRSLMSAIGEQLFEWEKNTWPVLQDLATNHVEAGIHFQWCKLLVRKKDVGSLKAQR